MHKNGKTIYLSAILFLIFSVSSFAGNYPFPQEANYPYGIRATNASSSTIQGKYDTWKATYVQNSSVCAGCLKVVSPEPVPGYGGGYTVSEGIAYGMLMSVYMDDQTTFDGLAKFKINRGNNTPGKPSNLLPWIIDSSGNIIDQGSATDADIDIAFAFLMADKQWGGSGTIGTTYLGQAQLEIADIKSYDKALDNHLKPGDQWDDHTFPSYFITAFIREFQTVDGDAVWATVANKCFTMINTAANSTTGLIGEIITTTGAAIDYDKNGVDGRKYDYNSCRVPWRTAMDYAWYGTAAADTYTTKLSTFFNSKGPTGIVDGYYYQNGTSYGYNNNAAFVGPAGCSFMVTTNQTSLNSFYTRTSSFGATESYYNGALQVLTMLFMSGNMPNFRIMDPEPPKTPTPVPDSQIIDYFEDYLPDLNTANDWGGYWYTWADDAGLGGTTVSPAEGGHLTMTAGELTVAQHSVDEDSLFHLRITGSKAAAVAPNYPSVGIGTELKPEIKTLPAGQDIVDLSDFWITKTIAGDGGGIRFWCKGDGVTSWKIMLGPKGAGTAAMYPDWASHEYEFIPPTTWTQISIPFGQFTQPSWTANTFDLETEVLPIMQEFKWQVGVNTAVPSIVFAIDNVELFPHLWEPTPVPTATFTPTATITATFGPSELLDDCEDADGVNNWGGDWFTYDDSPNSGTSVVSPEPGGIWYMDNAGAASTVYSARMTGTVTDVYANGFVGMGTNLMSTG
ncbi:MAG TPA: glycosyl hydrolase family 8, partial [Candidatus Goldiibacteriota bacterium]|nr:glycosyl hydrolase family 8 [Candidatus Goldiibacteriota bacterium]